VYVVTVVQLVATQTVELDAITQIVTAFVPDAIHWMLGVFVGPVIVPLVIDQPYIAVLSL
jgi:hypothetical protein